VHLEQVLSILSDKGPHPAVTENLLAMLGNTSPGAHLLGVADVNPIQAPSLQSPSEYNPVSEPEVSLLSLGKYPFYFLSFFPLFTLSL
jgi:hypothetical protein